MTHVGRKIASGKLEGRDHDFDIHAVAKHDKDD
jgi:hypothetical protein